MDVRDRVQYVDHQSKSLAGSILATPGIEASIPPSGSAIVIDGCLDHPLIFQDFHVTETTTVLWGGGRVCLFNIPLQVYIYEPKSRRYALLHYPSTESVVTDEYVAAYSPHFLSAFDTSMTVDINLAIFHSFPERFRSLEVHDPVAGLVFSDGAQIEVDLCSVLREKGVCVELMPAVSFKS